MKWWKWKLTPLKAILLLLFAGSVGVALYRLFNGLGAGTALTDDAPWGLWKAVDVIIVVPLGASGFTMAFVRYILKDERYDMIARRSVIWAAIAYLSMGARLAFDIGQPWRIMNPLLFGGNIHSPLFEVAWCVALYLVVLFVENLPRVLQEFHLPWAERAEHTVHKIAPVFVLFGVLLSSMHQSSLGTLYMIVGKRIDPLWYLPWLNYIYLLTAIAAGLSVTVLIEGWSSQYYKTPYQNKLLAKLGYAIGTAMTAAFVWRIYQMAAVGNLGQIFTARPETYLWWLEILVGFVAPIILWWTPKARMSRTGQIVAAALTVAGMIMLRLNVVFTGMHKELQVGYFPTWQEWLFTIGATAGTMVIYTWFVETLPTYLRAQPPKKESVHGSLAD